MENLDHDSPTARGVAIYSRGVLRVYDAGVLGFSNTFVWRCPTPVLLAHYNAHVSGRHLDVGVGTGYFLDHCRFPVSRPALTLMDLNPNSLAATAKRLRRYQPATVQADVLAPVRPATAPFDSIGINYLLHCLPGPMHGKGAALANLAALLSRDGVLFGSTILGRGVAHNWLGRYLMRTYNRLGIFDNLDDDAEGLTDVLTTYLDRVEVRIVGTVAIFAGHRPAGGPGCTSR